MTSKLPIRKNIDPILQIVSDLEKIKPKKITKIYSDTFNPREKKSVTHQKDHKKDDNYRDLKEQLHVKDDQINKLVEKLSLLYNYNNQYSVENSRLQNDIIHFQQMLEEEKAQKCENCSIMKNNETYFENDREKYITENRELHDDLKMMKTLVYRLNVQLENLQEILRKNKTIDNKNICKIDFDGNNKSPNHDELNWGSVNTHTLGPLLTSYQEYINDKNNLIQQYVNELNEFTGKLKDTVEENNKLHAEISDIKRNQESWINDKTRLLAQLDICRNKAEVQTKRADLAKEKLVEVLHCYEKKIQSQSLDVERLQEAYSRAKGEITTLRNYTQRPEVVVENLKECQKLFEELKMQHDAEKTRLTLEIEELKKSNIEDEKNSTKIKEEIVELKTLVKKQKELNEILNEKNLFLRQTVHRMRQTKEALKKKLKSIGIESGHKTLKNSLSDLNKTQALIQQKDSQIQTIQLRHMAEIEQLTRKLQHRENTLKKILQDKTVNRKN